MTAPTELHTRDQSADATATAGGPPESIQLGYKAWVVALVMEVINQIATATMRIVHPGEFRAVAEQAAAPDTPEALIHLTLILSAVLVAVISIAIMVVFFFGIKSVVKQGKRSSSYRLMSALFAGLFVLRAMSLFAAESATGLPWFDAFVGSLQIMLAAFAFLGAVFFYRKDSAEWIDEATRYGKQNTGDNTTNTNSE